MSDEKPKRDIVNDDSDLEEKLYVSYFYPDPRPHAPAFAACEQFILNPKAGDSIERIALDGTDVLYANGAEIEVPKGWLWKETKTVKVPRKRPKPTVPA